MCISGHDAQTCKRPDPGRARWDKETLAWPRVIWGQPTDLLPRYPQGTVFWLGLNLVEGPGEHQPLVAFAPLPRRTAQLHPIRFYTIFTPNCYVCSEKDLILGCSLWSVCCG